MLSFSSYGWLTVIAFLDSSEDKDTLSCLPRHFIGSIRIAGQLVGVERSSEKAYHHMHQSLHRHLANSRSRPAVYTVLACFLVN